MKLVARAIIYSVAGLVYVWFTDMLSTRYGWDLSWTILVYVTMVILIGEEALLLIDEAERTLWRTVSRTSRDKFVFSIALAIFWLIASIPEQQNLKPRWIGLSFSAVAFLLSGSILYLFGTAELRRDFFKRKRPEESNRQD